MKLRSAIITAACTALLPLKSYAAGPELQSGNILVSSQNQLYEYTPAGALVSQLTIPENLAGETARDLTVLGDGRIAIFNGTFSPELALYDGTAWEMRSISGWSTVNNGSYGGIAVLGNELLLTDTYTAGEGSPKGLLTVDLSSNVAERFVDTEDYIDVTVGQDGLIYALQNTYGDLSIFDSDSKELLRTVDLGHSSGSRAVTANASGDIFMVSWNDYIAHYDASGILIKKMTLGPDPFDIDLDSNGRIAVGGRFGTVYLTDEALEGYTQIDVTGTSAFVAIVPGDIPPPLSAPILEGSHQREGRWIITTLNWSTDADAVDIYFNDTLIDTQVDATSATYRQNKKLQQVYYVCNAGSVDCSNSYVASGGGRRK